MALTPASWRIFRRRFLASCAAALIVMVTTVVTLNIAVNNKIASADKIKGIVFPRGPAQGANYLIIGSDSRAFVTDPAQQRAFGSPTVETGQRADVMMVLHLDPVTKTSLLVSFPRDLLVNIPGQGRAQINSAFGTGPQLMIDTLKSDFNIDINHYIEINFTAFIGVVDAVGKINIAFQNPTRDVYSGLNISTPGCVPLDGNSALAFVRSRHREEFINGTWQDKSGASDLDRIKRQQEFIRKLAAKASAKASSNPLAALNVADAVLAKVKIDAQLGRDDILRLVNTFRNVDPTQSGALVMETIPNDPSTAQPGRLVVNDAKAAPMLDQLRTFGKTAAGTTVTVQPTDVTVSVVNGSGVNGAAAKALGQLQEKSFGPGSPKTGASTAKTEVRYAPNARAKAELVVQYLGGVGRLVDDPTIKDVDVTVVIGADWRGIRNRDTSLAAPTVPVPTGAPAGSGSKPSATTAPAGPAC